MVPEKREHVVTRHPYRIFYHVDDNDRVVEVWRMMHSAQQRPPSD